MEAIILAGGLGTRLRQSVPDLPKPMAPVAGRPFLEILLQSLSSKHIRRVVLSLGFMADKIIDHFGDRFAGMDLAYRIEELPLGTGGAVRFAMADCTNDHVYVFNGDTYLDLNIDEVELQWQRGRRPIIVGRNVADASRFGRLTVEGGRVKGLSKDAKLGPGLINAGCYVLNRGQLDAYALRVAFSLEEDYLTSATATTAFDLYVTTAQFIDIGVPEDYARAQIELKDVSLRAAVMTRPIPE